jgi:hypothetical protein
MSVPVLWVRDTLLQATNDFICILPLLSVSLNAGCRAVTIIIFSCNFRISISHTVSRGYYTWYDQQATRYIQVYIPIPAPLFFNIPTSYFLNCTSSFSKSVMPRRLLSLSLYAIVILWFCPSPHLMTALIEKSIVGLVSSLQHIVSPLLVPLIVSLHSARPGHRLITWCHQTQPFLDQRM